MNLAPSDERLQYCTLYSSIILWFYGDLVVEYATNEDVFLGVSSYEKGVGHIYSQSGGRGPENISGASPQTPSYFAPQEKILAAPLVVGSLQE